VAAACVHLLPADADADADAGPAASGGCSSPPFLPPARGVAALIDVRVAVFLFAVELSAAAASADREVLAGMGDPVVTPAVISP
jgi:hypothetical protein